MHPVTVILMAQSAVAAIDGAEPGIVFDLARIRPAASCTAGSSDIVVCARTRNEDRIGALPEIEIPSPAKAEFRLFGDVKAGAELEGGSVGGFVSNRAMVRVKIPL